MGTITKSRPAFRTAVLRRHLSAGARTKDTRVSIHPYFTVKEGKMDEFKATFGDFYKCVDKETNCFYYGFSVNDDERVVYNRECYDSAEGLLKHIDNTAAVAGPAGDLCSEVKLEIHGPAEELKKLEPLAKDIDAKMFVLDGNGFTNNNMKPGKDTAVSIHPYFKVPADKWDQFVAAFEKYYEAVKNEPNNHHYAFSFNKDEGIVFNREQYDSAEGLLAHIENTAPVNEVTAGLFDSVDLEIHGPASELEKLKDFAEESGSKLFVLDENARCYK
uniref:ABM domain-containing protein n=1 Tax=Lotharella oceanica TaxID=641309 RepID=A0A7S2TU70_9EUKA